MSLKFCDHVIESDGGHFKGSMAPMVDLGTYAFKGLNRGEITSKELFMNAYAVEIHELEQTCTSTKRLQVILDAQYEKSELNNAMKNQWQCRTETQRNKLLNV